MTSGMSEQLLEQIRREFRAEVAQAELRMTKWVFITAIGLFAVVVLATVPTLSGVGAALFLAGTALQMYAVARM